MGVSQRKKTSLTGKKIAIMGFERLLSPFGAHFFVKNVNCALKTGMI